jgi:hypothetical protein
MVMVGVIVNGHFEEGLASCSAVSGSALARQPILAGETRTSDVMIGGAPVPLGGDCWVTTAYPLGNNENSLIRIAARAESTLDSDPLTISAHYLAYCLGGSTGRSALEVRIPAATAKGPNCEALDGPGTDGYAVVFVAPSGSDILQEDVIDLMGDVACQSLVGATAKVRLRVSAPDADRVPQRGRSFIQPGIVVRRGR